MRKTLAALAALLSTASAAWAQDATTSNTIGSSVQTAMSDAVGPLIMLISVASFAGGLYLFARGLVRLKNVPSDRAEAGPAFAAIFAAVLLIALPDVAGVGITTVFGGGSLFGSSDLTQVSQQLDTDANGTHAQDMTSTIIGLATVSAPTSCLSGTGATGTSDSGNAVTCMAGNLAKNAVPIGIIAIFVFAFLAGLVTFASAILELTKGEREQRSPGLWPKMILSVLLMNALYLFMFSSNTLLGTSSSAISTKGLDTSSTLLKYTGTSSSFQSYADLIGYCFYILAFFGVFAFVRGIYMLKNTAENKGQSTYGAGMTFMVAGILLANAKFTTCMVLTTVAGASASAAGFCS